MNLSTAIIRDVVARALREDIGHAVVTSEELIPLDAQASAQFVMREAGVMAGLPLLAAVFAELDPALEVELCAADGEIVTAGAVVARLHGSACAILAGERVALNLLQRLCGIATLTAR
jgi:nicotinate-nucleotide pyrophosphorylase (carboxylating)